MSGYLRARTLFVVLVAFAVLVAPALTLAEETSAANSTTTATSAARLDELLKKIEAVLAERETQSKARALERRLSIQPPVSEQALELRQEDPEAQKAAAIQRLNDHIKEERQRKLDDLLLLRAQQLQ
jgi:hypothetical protein